MKTAIITTNPETERLCIIANRMARYLRRYGRQSVIKLAAALKESQADIDAAWNVAGQPYGVGFSEKKGIRIYRITGPSEVG